MKRVIFKLFLLLPIVVSVLAVNFVVDPAHLFKGALYEKGIADLLNQGRNVAIFGDVDDMLLQKFYIENFKDKKDVIAIGSSRLFQINSSFYPEQSFANDSVASLSSIDDEMLIYWFYKQKGIVPKKIILGLDPWLINKSSSNQHYKSLPKEYLEMTKFMGIHLNAVDKISLFTYKFDRFFQLFSPSYFQSSLHALFKKGKVSAERDYFSTDEKYGEMNIKFTDGSLSYNNSVRNRSQSEVDLAALSYLVKENDVVDRDSTYKIEKFIKILNSDGVEIVFLLSPYHPKTYYLITTQKHLNILDVSAAYFRDLAKRGNIRIMGSYNPADYNLTGADFYDGVHIKDEALRRIFQ